MHSFLDTVASFLPLFIKHVAWDGDSLVVAGDGWSFSTSSAWRVSQGDKLLFACWDDEIDICLEELVGTSIVEVAWLISAQPIDPSLVLSDGRRLDVFCSSSCDPWVMSLPRGIYVGGITGE